MVKEGDKCECVVHYIPSVLTEGILSTGGLGGPGGRAPSICARPAKRRGPTLAGPYRFPTRPCFTCDPRVEVSMLCIDCGSSENQNGPRGQPPHAHVFISVQSADAESIGAHRLVHGGVHAHLHRQRPHRVLMPHVEHKPERLARVKQDVGYRPKRDSRLRSNTRGSELQDGRETAPGAPHKAAEENAHGENQPCKAALRSLRAHSCGK